MKTTVNFMVMLVSLANPVIQAHTIPQEPNDEGYEFLKKAFCSTGNVDQDLGRRSEAREDFEEIRNNSRTWWHRFVHSSPTKESTLDSIRNFVYERSKEYAYNRTKDRSRATNIASRIENDFKHETERYNNKYSPPFGAYRSFIGHGLHERVRQTLNSHEQQHSPTTQQSQYTKLPSYRPSNKYSNDDLSNTGNLDSCPICTDNNIPDNDVRVYLPKRGGNCRESGLYDSCGHWMCIGCAAHNFLKETRSKCPLCNQQINISLLKNILAAQAAKLEENAREDSKIAAHLHELNTAWPGWRPPSAPPGW